MPQINDASAQIYEQLNVIAKSFAEKHDIFFLPWYHDETETVLLPNSDKNKSISIDLSMTQKIVLKPPIYFTVLIYSHIFREGKWERKYFENIQIKARLKIQKGFQYFSIYKTNLKKIEEALEKAFAALS
jgi:hypothetical protein